MNSTSPIMRYFEYTHLREGALRDTSKEFYDFAWKMEKYLPAGPEKSTALRKLLEAKDAAVRAALDLDDSETQQSRSNASQSHPARYNHPAGGSLGDVSINAHRTASTQLHLIKSDGTLDEATMREARRHQARRGNLN